MFAENNGVLLSLWCMPPLLALPARKLRQTYQKHSGNIQKGAIHLWRPHGGGSGSGGHM